MTDHELLMLKRRVDIMVDEVDKLKKQNKELSRKFYGLTLWKLLRGNFK